MSSSAQRRGFKAEGVKCLDHLPVIRGDGELAYMAPLTRLLVPRSAVSVLNCSQNFPLTFEDIKGRMIAANPGCQGQCGAEGVPQPGSSQPQPHRTL